MTVQPPDQFFGGSFCLFSRIKGTLKRVSDAVVNEKRVPGEQIVEKLWGGRHRMLLEPGAICLHLD